MSPPSPIRIGVLGGTGRMGTLVQELLRKDYAARAVLGPAPKRGESLEGLRGCAVVIDFSLPGALDPLLEWKSGPALVIGSTGWTDAKRDTLKAYAARTAVLQASNFSIGVQAMNLMLRASAHILKENGFAASMVETHHQHKKDAPSGTALFLKDALQTFGSQIPIQSIREGEVVGDHSVTLDGPAEQITILHHARDRAAFARGAIEAALWLAGKKTSGQILGMEAFVRERYA